MSPAVPSAVILMYHRVAEVAADPWRLAVSPAHFAEHMALLRDHCVPVPLEACARERPGGAETAGRPTVAVTFDDGYLDNATTAFPILQAHDIPASVFLATGYLGAAREFWWDLVERALLTSAPRPAWLPLTIAGEPLGWPTDDADVPPDRRRVWRAEEAPLTPRHAAYRGLWGRLQACDEATRAPVLAELARWAGLVTPGPSPCVAMTATHVRTLAASPLITFGAHTVTHPLLPHLPLARQRQEISESLATVARLTGRRVTSFAYPYGQYDDDTIIALGDAGVTVAVTTRPGAVTAGADLLRLPRVHVEDCDGAALRRQIGELTNR